MDHNDIDVDIIIFGGHGDLALRKIMPALFYLFTHGRLSKNSRIIAASNKNHDVQTHLQINQTALRDFYDNQDDVKTYWDGFSALLSNTMLDATQSQDYAALAEALNAHPKREKVYYLSTPSTLYGEICSALSDHDLIHPHTRVVLEKPIGHDLASFVETDNTVTKHFKEENIFRIDHYLGKDAVQNLLALRFSNILFSSLWNQQYIDHVQITAAETIGVEGRGNFYDRYGAMRDMIQNHLLQLVCLIAMEPPNNMEADSIRNEKVKVLKSLRPLDPNRVQQKTVRGQYREGIINGEKVPSYIEEIEPDDSETETFAAIKIDIDNWSWNGVPFYLRTGKRMHEHYSEITISFKDLPHSIFNHEGNTISANKLVIRLQPEVSINLHIMNKTPSLLNGIQLRPVELELHMPEDAQRPPTAYERLILDVINNDSTLFMRRDEVEAAWRWADKIIDAWEGGSNPVKSYPAGSQGPAQSISLIERDGRQWHDS